MRGDPQSPWVTLVDVCAEGEPEESTTSSDRPSASNFVETSTGPDFHETTTEFDTTEYDAMGNVIRITRLADTPNPVITTSTYEPVFNQIASITDPLLQTRSFGYDSKGRLTSVTDALNHTTTFAYNASRQVTSITDALQHTTQFTYANGDLATTTDALGRRSARGSP